MRLLVFGGRDFKRQEYIFQSLEAATAGLEVEFGVQGGADGVDAIALAWFRRQGIPCVSHYAAWEKQGRGAGSRRNVLMVQMWQPTHAVGFPGGKGTAHMRSILLKRPDIAFWDLTKL